MLRNVLSKLSGLASLTESYRPSTAKALSRSIPPLAETVLHRSRSLRRNEGCGVLRRSHSVPPPTKKYEQNHYGRFNESEDIQEDRGKYGKPLAVKEDAVKREPTQGGNEMTYELEAAKPSRSKSCVDFDVFKQMDNQDFEQEMIAYLQPSMLKPFGSSQSYLPNTFSYRAQNCTTPTFRMNEVMEGTRKIREKPRDTISEGTRRTFSTNSVPACHTRRALANKPLDTFSESTSAGASIKQVESSYGPKSTSAAKLKQEPESHITDIEQSVAESKATSSPSKKEHIFDSTIKDMIAAKKNAKWYPRKSEDVSINPPPFFGSRNKEEPTFLTRNRSSRVIDENRLTPPFPCFSERLKYNSTGDPIVAPQAEIFPKENVMDRPQMQTSKKGVEKIQRRAISTAEGPAMMKSATVLAAQVKRPSKLIDCVEEEVKPPEETIRMTPDGKKCFLTSKVRLKVPASCTPRPKHDCAPPPCVRADQCLTVLPKKLPYIPDGPCVCVEPYVPHVAPPIKRLNLKVTEPTRVCPPPLCPQPRADDNLPRKPKQLKPYVAKPCACVEPPPMVDVPLQRLPPQCPPEDDERCYPVKVCPVEVCVRSDEKLCVKPKKLPVLVPKDCPAIEPDPMIDVPLKRLNLNMPEPKRVCPCVENCPCPRADDNLKPKIKKLRQIVPGECLCIEPRYRDVNFKRLECIDEPEPCDVTDPCMEHPRADYGCWEYYTPPDPCIEAKKKAKKPKPNRMSFFKPSKRCLRVEPKNNFSVSVEKLKSVTHTKLSKSKLDKVQEVEKKQSAPASNPPMKNLTRSKVGPKPMVSETVVLLDKLKDIQQPSPKNKINFDPPKSGKIDVKKIMSNISTLEKESATSRASTTVRNLSTVLTPTPAPMAPARINEMKVSQREIATTTPTPKKDDDQCPEKKVCPKKPKPCPKGKCPASPLMNCPTGERRRFCRKKKAVDCCEKPPSPYPSFSEVMDEEIEPFSEHAQWTCKRKEFGFYPKTTKEFEPLDTKKNRKCFSTMSYNVKELLDQPPGDLESARGAKANHTHAIGATSERLENGCDQVHSYPITNIRNCSSKRNCLSTRNHSSLRNSSIRNYSSHSEKDKKTSVRICRLQREKQSDCTEEKCPKFEFIHCPPKTERPCDVSFSLESV